MVQNYVVNENGVCMNPEVFRSEDPKHPLKEYFEVEVACLDGSWYSGYRYGYSNGGGSSPVMERGSGCGTMVEALMQEIRRFEGYSESKYLKKYVDDVRRKVQVMAVSKVKSVVSRVEDNGRYVQGLFIFPDWPG